MSDLREAVARALSEGGQAASWENALEGADALILLTEWKAFRSPDLPRIREALRVGAIFDGRNVFDPIIVKQHGLDYYSIGRRPTLAD